MRKHPINLISKSDVQKCLGCSARADEISHLREQNRRLFDQIDQLESKLLSMAGDAAERYQRLRMTEVAHMQAGVMDGAVPLNQVRDVDPGDSFVDDFMSTFGKGRQ